MASENASFEYLVDAIQSLPSVGKKNAIKIAYYLLDQDDYYIEEFVNRIKVAKQQLKKCIYCNNLTQNLNQVCNICADQSRAVDQICIVTTCNDLQMIEDTNSFHGKYYVLWKELVAKKGELINYLRINKLLGLIQTNHIKEVTLATNLTVDGRYTAKLLFNYLKATYPNLNIYSLGLGLPINASIDYADLETIKYSLSNKQKIDK